jgi:hypothetical protein
MKRPNRVKIGAHWYRIEWIPQASLSGRFVGLCYHTSKVIKIAAGLPIRMTTQTLIHEIMHGIYYEWGLTNSEMPDEHHAAGLCSEENAVNGISQGFTTVLVDNPPLRRYIMWALK